MGLLDHRKSWRFTLAAPPDRCLRGFTSVFDGTRRGGPIFTRAKWALKQTPSGAVAAYQGRSGVVGFLTMMTEKGSHEQAGAVGSQVTFEMDADANGTTVCNMWLNLSSTTLGFTNDARFIRPYMRRVQLSLKEIDPQLIVQRG
ncbi:hypothetical protein [Streptacidiphilus carbonis]|uniref:hypothetical protein n=1 Tax=Streptacidiphilus carbonis TaxID=105422 RepID=UPI0005A5D6AE|nr:hypothetical protein [Streptacidiphilus carbonis]